MRAVQLDPGDANAQVALGIAAMRDNDPEAAQGPLEKAVVLQPRNPFALRTLGQLYLMKGNQKAALPHLRAAASVAPEDPINLFTYAQGLLAIEGGYNEAEADELFQRALRLAPTGELAEKIKHHQRRLAARVLRANANGQPRMDAVMYLSSALETYRDWIPSAKSSSLGRWRRWVSRAWPSITPTRNTTSSTTGAAPPSRVCRSLASCMWVCSSCCLGRMRGLIWRGNTRWRRGWRVRIRS